MRTRFLLPALLAAGLSSPAVADDPKALANPRVGHVPKLPPGFDPDKLADPAEAARAADWIEKEYAGGVQPEAVRMLLAILRKGPRIGAGDGWFGPADTRFTWAWLAAQCGVDPAAGAVPREKFSGPPASFDRLDRDGDGRVTPGDLDWSDGYPFVQQVAAVNRLFRRMDGSGDGRLTREELDEFFQSAARGKDHATAEDLRDVMLPRGGYLAGDAPTVPVLVRGLFAGEVGFFAEGPRPGEAAPDFTLKTVDGAGTVRLADLTGRKPVVLVFGTFSCGPFRALYPDLDAVYRRHKEAANFLLVYVREAHPTDGWRMASNDRAGVTVKQPLTFGERVKVCDQFCQRLRPAMPVVVDGIDDPAGTAYSGVPGRVYVLDAAGRVAYRSGRGPFGFKAGEAEQALVMVLLEAAKKP